MRTKSLLLAAAALAAGVLSSQAQTVYSANIVGYVNQALPVGYSLINNPLLNADGTNGAGNVLASIQPLDSILVWNGSGYSAYTYGGSGSWLDANFNPVAAPTLPQGQAVFYQNNTQNPETNTFVGTVVLTNSIPLVSGYTLIGSSVPIAAPVDSTNFGLPFQTLDSVLIWNGGGYTAYTYGGVVSGTNQWLDSNFSPIAAPVIGVGEGFFYQNNTAGTEQWNQSVTVQ